MIHDVVLFVEPEERCGLRAIQGASTRIRRPISALTRYTFSGGKCFLAFSACPERSKSQTFLTRGVQSSIWTTHSSTYSRMTCRLSPTWMLEYGSGAPRKDL